MNAVRAPNHDRALEFLCAPGKNCRKCLQVLEQEVGGKFHLDRQAGVENIR